MGLSRRHIDPGNPPRGSAWSDAMDEHARDMNAEQDGNPAPLTYMGEPIHATPLLSLTLYDALLSHLRTTTDAALAFAHGSSGATHHDGRVLGALSSLRLLGTDLGQDQLWGVANLLRQEIVGLRSRQANAKPGSAAFRHLAGQAAALGECILLVEQWGQA